MARRRGGSASAGRRSQPTRAAAPSRPGRAAARAARANRSSRPSSPPRAHRRLAVVYDIEPPHVRLGVAWFLLVMVAMAMGTYVLALLYAAAAAIAAYQAARCWRRKRPNRPDPYVAAGIAAALPVAASISTGALGLALLGSVAFAMFRAGVDTRVPPIATAARTLQCALWVGGAGAGVVAAHRFEAWAGFALVVAVSAYETGDYLVGSGARSPIEGPIAGAVAVFVVQFAISAVGLPPFDVQNGVGFALLGAALCPMGQLLGSLVLPTAAAPASAVRRLDSLLLLGPAWALAAGAVAATQV